jgi:hypothetical protein
VCTFRQDPVGSLSFINYPKLPLARKFPGKRKYWALAGKMPGNPFWKEIDRKYNELPG